MKNITAHSGTTYLEFADHPVLVGLVTSGVLPPVQLEGVQPVVEVGVLLLRLQLRRVHLRTTAYLFLDILFYF